MTKICLMLVLVAGILLHDAFALKRKSRGRRNLLKKRNASGPNYPPDSSNYSPNPNNYSPNPNNYSPDPNNYSPDPNNYSPNPNNYSPNTNNYSPNPNNYSPNPNNYSPDPNNYSPDSNNYSPDNGYNSGNGRPNIIGDNIGTAAGQPENDPQLCLQCPSNSLGILGQLRTFLGTGEGFFTLLNSRIDEYSPYGVYIFSTIRALNNFLTGCNNLNGIVPTSDDYK